MAWFKRRYVADEAEFKPRASERCGRNAFGYLRVFPGGVSSRRSLLVESGAFGVERAKHDYLTPASW